jgi:hypothetical protein
VEEFEHLLRENAVLYLNTDSGAVGQYLQVGGSPALSKAVRDAAEKISAPPSSQVDTLLQLWLPDRNGSRITSPLGMGSDYVAFAHHLVGHVRDG